MRTIWTVSLHGTGIGSPLEFKMEKCGLSGQYHYMEQVSVLPWNSKWKNADYLDSIITWNRYRFSPGIQNGEMRTIWYQV
ncbi:hypothetical protein RRG08_010331 [Elysia crispata]|uniref:Uncharacterized protein n=1 Tax=Elysia crispata TaxID=231223 RepID=A0AAE0Y707_9GAST|nr:hypothetical protein RRG08_010331 [Elysia crispata]